MSYKIMIKTMLKRIPVLGPCLVGIKHAIFGQTPFESSRACWESRYNSGGNSGAGSYDKLASFKADLINEFVKARGVDSVIELGCGDGNQISLGCYLSYLGFDISEKAIATCRQRFGSDPSKGFRPMEDYRGEKGQLALSLDVVYHLVEDEVFQEYMGRLFGASTHYVIIYASNYDQEPSPNAPHVRHRQFTSYIDIRFPSWDLIAHVPNRYPVARFNWGSFADFYIYERRAS